MGKQNVESVCGKHTTYFASKTVRNVSAHQLDAAAVGEANSAVATAASVPKIASSAVMMTRLVVIRCSNDVTRFGPSTVTTDPSDVMRADSLG